MALLPLLCGISAPVLGPQRCSLQHLGHGHDGRARPDDLLRHYHSCNHPGERCGASGRGGRDKPVCTPDPDGAVQVGRCVGSHLPPP
ncbi:unnamed protein product [Symbiodinium pilosum]|uniref:Uncharacterized protein n=1 Tax=Symbiodinium pilosum TaxID=2952 RepID=A0A812WC90_SYMPI|nr:unnamed protein product [Symbiodinium pilosum]